MGDYAPGTVLLPIMINVTVDEALRINHVGIGYHLQVPSGKLHASGFSWSGRDDALQEFVDRLLRAAADHEGVDLPPRAHQG